MLSGNNSTLLHHSTGEHSTLVQAAANELMAAEAEKSKWQSSINEVSFSTCQHCYACHSSKSQCMHTVIPLSTADVMISGTDNLAIALGKAEELLSGCAHTALVTSAKMRELNTCYIGVNCRVQV